jgi:hypothetical protein
MGSKFGTVDTSDDGLITEISNKRGMIMNIPSPPFYFTRGWLVNGSIDVADQKLRTKKRVKSWNLKEIKIGKRATHTNGECRTTSRGGSPTPISISVVIFSLILLFVLRFPTPVDGRPMCPSAPSSLFLSFLLVYYYYEPSKWKLSALSMEFSIYALKVKLPYF